MFQSLYSVFSSCFTFVWNGVLWTFSLESKRLIIRQKNDKMFFPFFSLQEYGNSSGKQQLNAYWLQFYSHLIHFDAIFVYWRWIHPYCSLYFRFILLSWRKDQNIWIVKLFCCMLMKVMKEFDSFQLQPKIGMLL